MGSGYSDAPVTGDDGAYLMLTVNMRTGTWVVYGFFIALLVYSSRHVCINISFLQRAKCTHDAGSSCSDWISVLYWVV